LLARTPLRDEHAITMPSIKDSRSSSRSSVISYCTASPKRGKPRGQADRPIRSYLCRARRLIRREAIQKGKFETITARRRASARNYFGSSVIFQQSCWD
jgi:hypothetical protein